MIVIPAIDIKDGRCVRLRQGNMDDATVFADNPADAAARWLAQGAKRLHLVDLNGAFAGEPRNLEAVEAVMAVARGKMRVQLGGGVRDMETVERLLGLGLEAIVIGTAAVKNPKFVEQACAQCPGRVIVGVDALNGMVATDGWGQASEMTAEEVARRFEGMGVSEILYTDIARDGMMQGPNVEATARLARSIDIPVIASGGVAKLDDVARLARLDADGVKAVIVGRALYEGAFDYAQAQKTADSAAANGGASGRKG